MEIRIGIDVGGTFTDAVAIDATTVELVGQVKVPTTHRAKEGVARGIIDALHRLLSDLALDASAVRFIAHGTTQATNAMLEGDVVLVGIVGMAGGLEALRARSQTTIEPIDLAPGKQLRCLQRFIASTAPSPQDADEAIRGLQADGARVIVASGIYSVDDASAEEVVIAAAVRAGLPGTGAHEMTKLYGLKTRTRTAAINASILPRMIETADSVEAGVADASIGAPLMIMRGDGGVMSIAQVRRRPILTLTSGPAAGVAGALMHEKVSDGIFLEVGGTSVDISAIRDGRVQLKYATLGSHQTFLQALDVRSLGIGGGSMIRLHDGILDVGPRSAHIADLEYSVFQSADKVRDSKLVSIQPLAGDPADYLAVETAEGRFALTLSCAANLAGYVDAQAYARGSIEAARSAFTPFAERFGTTVEAAARAVVDAAVAKVRPTVEALAREYGIDTGRLILIGGGGGAAVVVPALAKAMGAEYRIARNAEVISPIGVALALVRDTVERMIVNPSADDVRRVRAEAEEAAVASGARRETVEVDVVIDAQRNIVSATAVGATEVRTRDLLSTDAGEGGRRDAAAASLAVEPGAVELTAQTPQFFIYSTTLKRGGVFGLFSKLTAAVRVLDRQAVVRLRVPDGRVLATTAGDVPQKLRSVLEALTVYGDAGAMLPAVHLVVGDKIVNLTGLPRPELVVSLAADEMSSRDALEPTVIVAENRS